MAKINLESGHIKAMYAILTSINNVGVFNTEPWNVHFYEELVLAYSCKLVLVNNIRGYAPTYETKYLFKDYFKVSTIEEAMSAFKNKYTDYEFIKSCSSYFLNF